MCRHCGGRQWKEKECARPTLPFHRGGAHRARSRHVPAVRSDPARTCSPANARLECDPAWGHGHVLVEGQRTPPLPRCAAPRRPRGMRGCAHVPTCPRTCVYIYIPTYVRACVRRACASAHPTAGGPPRLRPRRVAPMSAPVPISTRDPRHCGRTTFVEGMPTSVRDMLPCYVARQLDILRSARTVAARDDWRQMSDREMETLFGLSFLYTSAQILISIT